MPRTTTAAAARAKRKARERQRETGEAYMQALGKIFAEDPGPDWTIQLDSYEDGSAPYPFVVNNDGVTYGFIDYGILIGFSDSRDARRIEHYWPGVAADPTGMVGKWMVTRDRFTGTWSTWGAPVRTVTKASPRAERDQFMGGTGRPAEGLDAERLAWRALADRPELLEDGQTLTLDIGDGSPRGITWIDVDDDWTVREPERGIALGLVEAFVAPGGQVVPAEAIREDPRVLIGAMVRFRSRDHGGPGTQGPVRDVTVV